jgi:hypothetical protein
MRRLFRITPEEERCRDKLAMLDATLLRARELLRKGGRLEEELPV